MKTSEKWLRRFLHLAKEVQSWSKDSNHQVGCVLVSPDGKEFITGYNGPPASIESGDKELIIHAEQNALINSNRDITGWIVIVTRAPCAHCAAMLAQKKVALVYSKEPEVNSSWYASQIKGRDILMNSNVERRYYKGIIQ